MRYSPGHKQETRRRLLEGGRAIAKKGGFESTGVDTLMASIGLTGGAFYNHFPSKAALFKELIERELENSAQMLAGDENSPSDHVAKRLRSYLSTAHALNPETGCAIPTLGAEIARAPAEVRRLVEQELKRIEKSWSERLQDSADGWAVMAQCVGAIVLARVVESEATRKDILKSSRHFIDKQRVKAGG